MRPARITSSRALLFFFTLFLMLLTWLSPAPGFGAKPAPGVVGILISREILPYMQMVQGLEKNLKQTSARIYLDKAGKPYSQESRFQELKSTDFTVMVAVGPQALAYLQNRRWPGDVLYAMVLNPERFFWKDAKTGGISLDLSPWKQLLTVNRVFPQIKRLGVLYNPEKNQTWFNRAKTVMTFKNLALVPLQVNRRADIPALFNPPGPEVDAILFIPDQTVISRSMITYVIKESLRLGISTFGFNRFFHESGAALSFIIDYEAIGRQIAAMVQTRTNGNNCATAEPPFTVLLNRKVIDSLKIPVAGTLPEGVIVE
ncbi:MAG: ABC transporter substrate binding protein [Pseudomonadota bacterium]|nr:ABC transporter substrate binding protein [Pseudomonadota bacterium]